MIAQMINLIVRGWLNYFTKFKPSAVKYTIDWLNRRLVKWAMNKNKRFRGHRSRAQKWLRELAKRAHNVPTLGSRYDSVNG
ncbi:group II intron maturase [Tepidibacillus fermentans]|uniref:Group II intron maturase n=2 Tax=Tepidibacillus fermentans TaxID=1281767 RepID=A0A4R3KKX7_9BACI|nr:group II intron maturase [Tepidibacillus fermentans]